MPKVKKDIDNLKHPNSRKTKKAISKSNKRAKKAQNKISTQIKQNLIGEKILWFKERIPEECVVLTKGQTLELIEEYLARFDEELEQIDLKNSIGQRINRQHASREDLINMTKRQELEEFETCGIQMVNLLDRKQIEVLKKWHGELRFLKRFKLKRIARKELL